MNSKEFLLSALDAEMDCKNKAFNSLSRVRSLVERLPENHLTFLVINRQQSIKKQAEEIMRFLWQLEKQCSISSETEHTVSN